MGKTKTKTGPHVGAYLEKKVLKSFYCDHDYITRVQAFGGNTAEAIGHYIMLNIEQ